MCKDKNLVFVFLENSKIEKGSVQREKKNEKTLESQEKWEAEPPCATAVNQGRWLN